MIDMKSTNVYWHVGEVTKTGRQKLSGHRSFCLWFTGLSASGKSTIALELEQMLFQKRIRSFVLDGDNIRHGLNKNLGFSPEDRTENIRRIGEAAKLFVEAGVISLTAFISPYRSDRDIVRELLGKDEFVEVYIKCDIATCEQRDPKGLYKKAREGEIKGFTGISAPYEEPLNPEFILDTSIETDVTTNARKLLDFIESSGYLSSP